MDDWEIRVNIPKETQIKYRTIGAISRWLVEEENCSHLGVTLRLPLMALLAEEVIRLNLNEKEITITAEEKKD